MISHVPPAGKAARRAKRHILRQLREELPKLQASLPQRDALALSAVRTLANLAVLLTNTSDNDVVEIIRLIDRIETEMATARRAQG